MLAGMHPEQPPRDRDDERRTWTGSELDRGAPQEPAEAASDAPQEAQEPEREPEPRTGSIAPPGAETPPPPAGRVERGGLLARLRSRLRR